VLPQLELEGIIGQLKHGPCLMEDEPMPLDRRHFTEAQKMTEQKLRLGKGAAFVKGHLHRLPQSEEVWEADIRPANRAPFGRGW
jgi:hypothetical protein